MEEEINNIIVIGKKEFLVYVRSADLLLKKAGLKKIYLQARGKNIVRAIDLAEAITNKYLKDLEIKKGRIEIGTMNKQINDRIRPISFINIELKK